MSQIFIINGSFYLVVCSIGCILHEKKTVMIQDLIIQWEENKYKLEEYFKTTNQEEYSSSYETIVREIFKLCFDGFDLSKMTVIDDGGYQGTQIFIIPKDTYEPDISDYVITNTYYGSCGSCDTLLSICKYEDGLPTNEQVKEYMTLALHLVQKLKWLGED